MTPTSEEWRAIPGWEGRYESSSEGRIRSLDRTIVRSDGFASSAKGRVLKQIPTKRGDYLAVAPSRNGRQSMVLVHLLITETFCGPRNEGLEVRHLNGNGLDNRATNLAWGTHLENERDKLHHGTHHQASKTHCPQNHPYDDANTYVWINPKTGGASRICRACTAARKKKPAAI